MVLAQHSTLQQHALSVGGPCGAVRIHTQQLQAVDTMTQHKLRVPLQTHTHTAERYTLAGWHHSSNEMITNQGPAQKRP